MEFGTLLSDPAKCRRLISAYVAVLLAAIVCAAVGLSMAIAPLTVFAVVLLAGCLGAIGKLLITVVVHLHGAAGRLNDLNDRYDETEQWLEQFDRGTRTTFMNLSKSQGELRGNAKEIQASLGELRQSIESFATREALEASTKSATTESAKLSESVSKIGKRVDQTTGEAKEMSRALQEIEDSRERLETSIELVSDELDTKAQALQAAIEKGIGEQDKLRQAGLHTVQNDAMKQIESVGARFDNNLSAMKRTVDTSSALASRLRGDGYVRFPRLVGADFVDKIKSDIGEKLGLSIEHSQMRYLERKIQQIEAVCEGRLATTSEDAIARFLAARSCQTDELKVLEIGVLFGIGTAFMHTALVPFYERVELFLLDPFDGYYGSDNLDPLTGQTISRAAVERNMKRAAIDPCDVHILEGFSTDDAILMKAKAAGPFDVIVIDGDHSYDGVKADYERYARLVVEGGVLIVDDYGSEDWPDVTKYVDEVLMKDDRFDQVGVLSRTAIFRRSQNGKAAPKGRGAVKKLPATSKPEAVLPAGEGTDASSAISKKIAKKVAAKKASKKAAPRKAAKKSPTKKKTQPAKKRAKPLAEEIAGEPKPVADRT